MSAWSAKIALTYEIARFRACEEIGCAHSFELSARGCDSLSLRSEVIRHGWSQGDPAARDVEEQAARARKALDQIKAEKAERAKRHAKDEAKKSEAKASMTDAEARSMRFPDNA
jgi:hypothetical protein